MLEILDLVRAWAGMSRSELVSTTGAGFGFFGGVILAYAASREPQAHRLAISALRLETTALVDAFRDPTAPLFQIAGTDKHIKIGQRWNTWLTRAGIICLTISITLTVGAFFVTKP